MIPIDPVSFDEIQFERAFILKEVVGNVIRHYCYDIDTLYDWIFVNNKNTNPSTNNEIENIDMIRTEIRKAYYKIHGYSGLIVDKNVDIYYIVTTDSQDYIIIKKTIKGDDDDEDDEEFFVILSIPFNKNNNEYTFNDITTFHPTHFIIYDDNGDLINRDIMEEVARELGIELQLILTTMKESKRLYDVYNNTRDKYFFNRNEKERIFDYLEENKEYFIQREEEEGVFDLDIFLKVCYKKITRGGGRHKKNLTRGSVKARKT